MKKAFETNAFTNGNYSILDTINIIADHGFNGVGPLMDYPHIWPFKLKPKDIREIVTTLQKRNMKISGLNAFTCSYYWFDKIQSNEPGQNFGPCFCDYEKESRQLRIDYTKKVIDVAVELGAKDISTCSGIQPVRGSRPMAWQNMVNGLKEVVEYAEKKKTRINIEAEPGLIIGCVEEVIAVVKEINSPYFGAQIDWGHHFVSEENFLIAMAQLWQEIPDRIHTTHIEDIGLDEKGRPVHYHLIPGQGAMPLKDIFQMFRDNNYKGWYTIELYTYSKNPEEAVRESIKYLTKMEKMLKN